LHALWAMLGDLGHQSTAGGRGWGNVANFGAILLPWRGRSLLVGKLLLVILHFFLLVGLTGCILATLGKIAVCRRKALLFAVAWVMRHGSHNCKAWQQDQGNGSGSGSSSGSRWRTNSCDSGESGNMTTTQWFKSLQQSFANARMTSNAMQPKFGYSSYSPKLCWWQVSPMA
jgi:hypothetical protein